MSDPIQIAKDVVGSLLSEFISYPSFLDIEAGVFGRVGDITISAHKADTPRLIGRGGRRFKAIETIVKAIGERHEKTFKLNRISDPKEGRSERYKGFAVNPEWPKERIKGLLERASAELFGTVIVECHDRGSDRTIFAVHVDADTPARRIDEITEAFNGIFDAIGKANGRELMVGIENSLPVDRQPETSAGRFCK